MRTVGLTRQPTLLGLSGIGEDAPVVIYVYIYLYYFLPYACFEFILLLFI